MSQIAPIAPASHTLARAARHVPAPPAAPAPPVHALLACAVRRKGLESIAAGFATMQSRFLPAKAKGLAVRMQFILTGPGGGEWFVVIKNGECTVSPGRGDNPDTTLQATAADYLKISNGEMNKISALMRGKLRVKGDMGSVRPFFGCFAKER